jgi:hypothetical protein
MTTTSPQHLSDRDLLDATVRAAKDERRSTIELLALLGEVDARRLYLGEGCSSLFTYCTQVLHLSEHGAYHRIEAARVARQFSVILDYLAQGALTLTTIALLRPHLTSANHTAVLEAAKYKSKREVEHQVACLAPRPDARTVVRKVAEPMLVEAPVSASSPVEHAVPPPANPPRTVTIPLAETRYLIKVTVSAETHAKLRRAQQLLRHQIPTGDAAVILDRALTLLVAQAERTKIAAAARPRPARSTQSTSRHVPAAVKRAVWERDQGRCAFEGPHGRCRETGQLEFHHLVPFAAGGRTVAANLALRCRAHNQFESDEWFGTAACSTSA